MVKTAELEQGLNNLFGGLLASQSKAAQANPVYKYLIEHPEIFKTPSDEPYRVCRRVNILRDYPDDKTKLYPRN
ncbi:hypothetical protein MXF95_002011 [Acinetobacter baumannii]|nr:hypothetical protein [Acinetobacter baumannii]EKW4295220.1 hypothetical protein [Acinetobacter baumannii]EKW4442552.1 hypothetical protein [Acinetobacter baumannii]EKW8105450.1 hypothetical protein [Acinetobacter baumannii]